MTEKHLTILVNIIGAVESGGQVYGHRDYGAYASPYTNTANEHTITLGWAQNYGNEASKLISLIYENNPRAFINLDTSTPAIRSMLGKDWEQMRWAPNASQKRALIAIISSPVGKQCQDKLFMELMTEFIQDCANDYTDNVQAQMMYCEVRHLGGRNAANRIFTRCNGNYSVDNILDCLNPKHADLVKYREPVEHQKFWSRHKKCAEFVQKYVIIDTGNGKKMNITAQQIVEKAKSYIGYREKNHPWANMENFTEDAGDGNFQKFQELAGAGNGDQWCQYFVDGIAVEITGSIAEAKKLLCQDNDNSYMTGYTPTGASYFKQAGRWYTTPEIGDVVYFYSSSMGRICHVGYVESVNRNNKTFNTVEGNTNSDGFTTNGGCVARHSYSYENVGGGNRVTGFGRPRYNEQHFEGTQLLIASGQKHSINFTGYLIDVDGVFGPETLQNMIRCLQHAANLDWDANLEEDGVIGPKTRQAFVGHYIKLGECQSMITAVEIICYCFGKNPNGVENPGVFGNGLKKALGKDYLSGEEILKLVE